MGASQDNGPNTSSAPKMQSAIGKAATRSGSGSSRMFNFGGFCNSGACLAPYK